MGTTILEAARRAQIPIRSECGGNGTCARCAVRIGPQRRQVLACQYRVSDDLDVYLPTSGGQIQTKGPAYPQQLDLELTQVGYGIACDIGTTTVAVSLNDLATGAELGSAAELNPQTAFGVDVISRIHYASTPAGLAELQAAVVRCIDRLILQVAEDAGIQPGSIQQACVVGNTTMTHLLLGLPVEPLGQAPYRPFSLEAHNLPATQLGLHIAPEGQVYVVEAIAGFVGADTTAVALAVGIDKAQDGTLVLDIGTNGELLLVAAGQVVAASCAAGPAFEGATITFGSRAIEGAIERVWVDKQDLQVGTIGGGPARSICGSGLVDLMACLLESGLVDHTGRLAGPGHLPARVPDRLAKRMITYQ
ncbi:MAG: ASKHA domain-containing protein, partial [Sedimentisphaerales bacterium]|nr:ASKHA domain-containing protein [Sedimentisphaerales bacterium]